MDGSNMQWTSGPETCAGRKASRLVVEARGAVALVTNAHSELGQAFVDGLLERGAARIYAIGAASGGVADDRVRALRADMTSAAGVARAVDLCLDVNLLVAHQPSQRSIFGLARRELDSTVYDVMRLARAFAPRLARNGGGGLVNVLPSAARGARGAGLGGRAVGAAALAVTEALRTELKAQGTAVLGVHPGDWGFAGASEGRSGAARRLVRLALDALCAGQPQVFADSPTEEAWAFMTDRSLAHAAVL
jgi:NAD(P)-dependent dehydrogenase (short-subunit alcohol dehydrogenase family)